MIDSSIGGKTGVDVPAGKNLLGAFHQPRLVIADLDVLGTLPPVQLAAGMAEAVKHGAIADAAYFAFLERGRVPRGDRRGFPLEEREVRRVRDRTVLRSEEHTSELQSQSNLVCRLLLGKKKNTEFHA